MFARTPFTWESIFIHGHIAIMTDDIRRMKCIRIRAGGNSDTSSAIVETMLDQGNGSGATTEIAFCVVDLRMFEI